MTTLRGNAQRALGRVRNGKAFVQLICCWNNQLDWFWYTGNSVVRTTLSGRQVSDALDTFVFCHKDGTNGSQKGGGTQYTSQYWEYGPLSGRAIIISKMSEQDAPPGVSTKATIPHQVKV